MQQIQIQNMDIERRFKDVVSVAYTSILEERRDDFDEIDIRINRATEENVQPTSHPTMAQHGVEVLVAGLGERSERYMEELFHGRSDTQGQQLLQGSILETHPGRTSISRIS